MKFEGTQVNIPIKGIMRAGTDNLCADGAMNEVIGMEYKDGSWLPYAEKEKTYSVRLRSNNTSITDIKKVLIHTTTDNASRYIMLRSNGALMYEVGRTGSENLLIEVSQLVSNVVDFAIMGNMVCVACSTGMRYFLWDDNRYTENKTVYPKVQLRASAGYINEGQKRYGTFYVNRTDGSFSNENIRDFAIAAVGTLEDAGGLGGYHLAQIGFRLKNGDLVCISPMQLLMSPQHYWVTEYVDGAYQRINVNNYSDGFYEANANPVVSRREFVFSGETTKYKPVSANGEIGDPYAIVPFAPKEYGEDIDFPGWICKSDGAFQIKRIIGDGNKVSYQIEKGDDVKTYLRLFGFVQDQPGYTYKYVDREEGKSHIAEVPTFTLSRIRHRGDDVHVVVTNDELYCIMAGNGLQFNISNIPDNTEIQSVCVFLSQSVSPYKLTTKDGRPNQFMWTGNYVAEKTSKINTGHQETETNMRTYSMYRRTEKEIIDELRNIKQLYLVHEVPLSEIESTNNWIDIDLQGKLGAALTTQESLPLSALHYQSLYPTPKGLDVYNYRLHVYDIIQSVFGGYPSEDFSVKGGFLQNERITASGGPALPKYRCEVDVFVKSGESQHKISVYYDSTSDRYKSILLEPFIFFPDKDAYKIRFRVFETIDGRVWYEKELPLSKMEAFDGAYYFDPTLSPIKLIDQRDGNNQPLPRPVVPTPTENASSTRHNLLKVSDIDYPSYFPLAYTYTIGNGRIQKIARLTMPLSQDNFGRNPLVVFCTDGIYSLRVDTSGNGVYTETDFVSPDICTNPNSICEIGGGIMFAGEKGLMIVVGNAEGNCSVEEFSPFLNGVPRFLPASEHSKEALGVYRKMIDNTQILSQSTEGDFYDSISQEDFKDFIANSDTHLIYISNKNKLLAYNKSYDFSYFIDIPTRNTTKLSIKSICNDGQLLNKELWEKQSPDYTIHSFGYLSDEDAISTPCLVTSRPIKIQQDDKCSYRVVITGYFEGEEGDWADLLVLGSLDADNWRVIGVKEKKLVGGFHNIGCLTERGSWKYMMFIFGGKLANTSHIDSVDITVDGRYNNKKR